MVAEERRTVAKVLEDKVLKISNEAGNSFCYCHAPSSKNLIGRREDKIAFLLIEKKYIYLLFCSRAGTEIKSQFCIFF